MSKATALPPTTYTAPGTGIASSRSDWTKDAVQLLFKCGPTRESHEERAIGAFLIYRGDWLTATAKMAAKSGLAQDTIDWNCVTFGDTKQTWTQDQAKIIVQEDTPAYTYLVGDLTGAYRPNDIPTIGHYFRTIFFLKPGFFLIRDEFNLIDLSKEPKFHLHTLDKPAVDMTGFTAVSSAAGTKLFGTAAAMPPAVVSVQKSADQTPTWRLDFVMDSTGGFCVALEAAPASQAARTVTMFVPPGLRGAVLGNDMAAVVTGDLPVTYKSPVTGQHYLLGLKPSTDYGIQEPSGSVIARSSAAGVLQLAAKTGINVKLFESGVPPPPPPMTVTGILDSSRKPITGAFDSTPAIIIGTGFGAAPVSVTVAGLPAVFLDGGDTEIGVILPKLPTQFGLQRTGPITVTAGGQTAASPFQFTLTSSAPPPPPPPTARQFLITIPAAGAPSIKEVPASENSANSS